MALLFSLFLFFCEFSQALYALNKFVVRKGIQLNHLIVVTPPPPPPPPAPRDGHCRDRYAAYGNAFFYLQLLKTISLLRSKYFFKLVDSKQGEFLCTCFPYKFKLFTRTSTFESFDKTLSHHKKSTMSTCVLVPVISVVVFT